MDLLSSIRKSGSRGGVSFSWDEVSTSQHRENYLGHSLMAPVGRWQKGRDLSWYAKGDDEKGENGETAGEKRIRERKEEISRIKEAEEDALATALGLPVKDRSVTGVNAISLGEVNRMVKEAGVGGEEGDELANGGKGFGDFVGKVEVGETVETGALEPGLTGKSGDKGRRRRDDRSRSRERRHRKHRHRSRSGERRRHRSRSGDRHRHRRRHDERDRIRSVERQERRYRSRSPERHRRRPEGEERRLHSDYKPRRSRSPDPRDRRREEDLDRRR